MRFSGMSIQPNGAKGIQAQVEWKAEFVPELADLLGFSHIILICTLLKSTGFELLT